MGHVDRLLLLLDLLGAIDAGRDGGHHVAPPCAVFSPLRCCREATPSVAGARIFESRLDPVKQFHFRWRWTGASSIVLALPLSGHTHPLLTGVIHELPYGPETVERVHGRDHRPPDRPLSHGKGDRSDLNKRAINHGASSHHSSRSIHCTPRAVTKRWRVPTVRSDTPASSLLTLSREVPAFFVRAS